MKIGKYGRARIWEGALPNIAYEAANVLRYFFDTQPSDSKGLHAMLELQISSRSFSNYGLLGGSWAPNQSYEFTAEVSVSSDYESLLTDNLATNGDEVRIGLLPEYAEAVSLGLNFFRSRSHSLPSGVFILNRAAHAKRGSSVMIFRTLTIVLLDLIERSSANQSDDELSEMFQNALKSE